MRQLFALDSGGNRLINKKWVSQNRASSWLSNLSISSLLTSARRLKLSNDPNNTKWSKDTGGFGHKIMTSQGWQPGEYLGAKDAPHAEFHTEANASHIRVQLKDDTLGIGAKKGSGLEQGECVGLDVFQMLLGRLNGADEDELAREQRSREDLKRAIYTEKKWGSIRFISGGFLIGDKIQDLIDGEAARVQRLAIDSSSDSDDSSDSDGSASESETTPEPVVVKQKKSKKSKSVVEIEVASSAVEAAVAKSEKSKKKRKLAEAETDDTAEVVKAKKSKKSRKSEGGEDATESESAKRKSKKEKKDKKDKKEKKSKKKSSEDSADSTDANSSESKKSKSKSKKSKKSKSETDTADSSEATPVPTEAAPYRPILLGGRHAVRSRNIAQKRLAGMDSASLNEVCLI